MHRSLPFLLAPFFLQLVAAAPTPTPEQIKFFDEKVFPVLESKCFKCHGGEDKLKGGFRVTSYEGMVHGGEIGSALDKENPAKSLFLEMISYKDDEHMMPPKSKLPPEEMAALTKWVTEMGAVFNPGKEIRGPLHVKEQHIQPEDFEYWAYKKVERPEPPRGNQHPVDGFIAHQLDEAGLEANPRASRQVLIRRATYDLTGLPPTPEEVEKFVSELSKAA